jgi:hypothetical protein
MDNKVKKLAQEKNVDIGGLEIDNQLFTESDMQADNGAMVYQEDMTVDAIPDLNNMMELIIELIEFMNTPEMIIKKRQNKQEYEDIIFFKYRDSYMPRQIMDLLVEDPVNNLAKIISMFETLAKIKAGEASMEKEYEKFTEEVNEEYLYPSFGGKQQFQEAVMKESKSAKRRAKRAQKSSGK